MSFVLNDPLLADLLLEYIEPKMVECLERYGNPNDGTRKLLEFTQYFMEDPPHTRFPNPRYSLIVSFNENSDSYRFNIFKDGRIEA